MRRYATRFLFPHFEITSANDSTINNLYDDDRITNSNNNICIFNIWNLFNIDISIVYFMHNMESIQTKIRPKLFHNETNDTK